MRGVRRVSKRKFQLLFGGNNKQIKRRVMSTKEEGKTSSSIVLKEHCIEFTERENGIFDIVRGAITKSEKTKKIVARVAGGWVRDKILGRPSDDIDIAVDTMSGFEFATMLDEYLASSSSEGEKPLSSTKVTRIKANPDQSKHLETATMRIMGRDIDFVHLRTEEYTDASRIPVIKVGTAQEDAYRRDLTINALFYNINDDVVEDFTGKGLEDLRKGMFFFLSLSLSLSRPVLIHPSSSTITTTTNNNNNNTGMIRTPLEPLMTFLDDPLRVLRSLRFMHRYDFKMTKKTRDACMNKEVRVALRDKVSPERIGIEMKKMLKGPNALTAMRHVFELNLHRVIFKFPESSPNLVFEDLEEVREIKVWKRACRNIDRLVELRGTISMILSDVDSSTNETGKGDKQKKSNLLFSHWQSLVLGAIMRPFHDLKFQSRNSIKATWKPHPISEHIILNSLKWPKKVGNDLRTITDESLRFKALMSEEDTFDVARTGMVLRSAKSLWPVALCLALVDSSNDPSNVVRVVKFHNLILGHELPRIASMRNPLNGKDLIKFCGVKPGPSVGVANEKLWLWLFLHPNANREDCIKFVRGLSLSGLS
jgi:tRNA nucleotidyltransferase (CCA-adding enzyme)